MNKKMRELRAKIAELLNKAKVYREDGDIEKATNTMDEIDALEKEYALEARVFEAEKKSTEVPVPAPAPDPDDEDEDEGEGEDDDLPVNAKSKKNSKLMKAIKSFAAAARRGFDVKKSMNEGSSTEGGYTVPEDIVTQIEHYRTSKRSLLDLVRVVPVTTNKGGRTFKRRSQQTGFVKVAEGGKIGAKATPQYTRITYEIDKYAGYFPVTSELLEDSDANIANELVTWIGDESRVTANRLILEQVNTRPAVAISSLDDVKKILNVTLGAAFKETSAIITNDDGLQWLDTLKNSDEEYLLQKSPADPMKLVLSAGATTVPIEVYPNMDMPSTPVYGKTEDVAVVGGKSYFVLENGVYTGVETPVDDDIDDYYEQTGANIPMVIGDLYEGIIYWDRKQLNIKASDVAVVGELNAFEEDLQLFRAIEREDVTTRDTDAFVNGYITVTAA